MNMNSFSKFTTAKYEGQALNPFFHCGHHMSSDTPVETNRKGKNILTQQWIPNEKQGKNKNDIKLQKDCTEAPMPFSESGKEVQTFLIKERGKRAESWKAEAFPQSRNFINLHLKVTDSTHKTTAGLHTNRTTRAKFWYLQLHFNITRVWFVHE